MVDVSIIIISYNTKDLLKNCLLSLFRNNLDKNFEVIVVDNGSSDESVEVVKSEFQKVVLIENKENLGFGKAINKALEKAKGDFLLFLNSDTTVSSNIVTSFVEKYKSDAKVGIIGAMLKNPDMTVEKSYGNFYTLLNVFYLLFGSHFIKKASFIKQGSFEVDWVSGGCMFIKTELFKSIGKFDEKIFMYLEDMEICYRVKIAGFKVLYDPAIIVTHIGQGSSNRGFAVVHIYQGLLYFFAKHKPWWQYVLIRAMLRTKARVLFWVGKLYNREYLVITYGQALAVT